MAFELREIAGNLPSQRFEFGEGLLDDVLQALQEDYPVTVAGFASPARAMALAIVRSTW